MINNIQEKPVYVRLSAQKLTVNVNDCMSNFCSIFICVTPRSYLQQHSIDFRITMIEKKTQENVKIRKCMFEM